MKYDPDALDWRLDPERYERWLAVARRLRGYFRPIWSGFEALRSPGGMFVVANHGLFGHELPLLQLGVHEVAHRPLRSLSDHVLFLQPTVRRLMMGIGVCDGTPAVAHLLMSRGELVYTCPGGAREALAPARDRYKLYWDGHYGFVRAAIRARAAIVPLAIVGIDETYRQLMDAEAVGHTLPGRLIARLLGEKYLTPVYVGLGPLPLPQQLHFNCGAPIEVPDDPDRAGDLDVVRRLHATAKRETERLLAEALAAREARRSGAPPGLERTVDRLVRRLAG